MKFPKNTLIRCTALLYFVILTSCNGQIKEGNKTGQDSTKYALHPWPPVGNLMDIDPYFTETNTLTTFHGPQSISRNIIQDNKGYMWFATWEGIMRYDPLADKAGEKAFTNFTNTERLRRYHTFAVMEDKSGDIWFGSIGAGLYRYTLSEENPKWINYTTADGLVHNGIGCIYQDKSGKIWFGTQGGVSCYDPTQTPKEGASIFQNLPLKDAKNDNDVNSIIEDKSGRLWFGARGQAYRYDKNPLNSDEQKPYFLTKKDGQPFTNVRCVIEDSQGSIWLGGNDGLWSFDGNNYSQYSSDFVGYIYEDIKSNIWFGSVKPSQRNWTLAYYENESTHTGPKKYTFIKEQQGQIFGIMEDKDGKMWFGHERGVSRFDPSSIGNGDIHFENFRERK